MKRFSLKKMIAVLVIPSMAMLFINNSYAEQSTPINPAGGGGSSDGDGGGGGADNLIGGYGSNYLTAPSQSAPNSNFYLFTQSPSWNSTITDNLFFNYLQSLSTNELAPTTSTTSALNTLLTATSSNSSSALSNAMTQYFPLTTPNSIYNFANGQANGTTINSGPGYNGSNANTQTSSVNSLNLSALIEPIQYNTNNFNTAVNAENFIKYISNQYNPVALIDFTKIIAQNNLSQALGLQSVQQYLYTLRKMLAGYSVGMSNLYYLYHQRIPENTSDLLGSQFNSIVQSTLPGNLQKQASPLALEQWMAIHRLTSYDPNTKTPPWIASMENATPATLQRETVYLLAEIRYEMFQQRMLQQRILATLSVQQLQNLGPQQVQLQQAENMVCSQSLFTNSNACPSPPQTQSGSVASTPPPTNSK